MSGLRNSIGRGFGFGKVVLLSAVVSLGAAACAGNGAQPPGDEGAVDEATSALDVDSEEDLGTATCIPRTCTGIESAMKKWVAKHRSCGDGLTCEYIPELDNVNLCEIVAAKKKDRRKLDALLQAYKDKGCTSSGVCGHAPGTAVCESGTCTWKRDTSCEDCPTNLDPQCTVDNRNARNACMAEHCLKSKVAHPGFCEDSAQCKGAGGTCVEWLSVDAPLCPDGTRWEGSFWSPEATKGCAGGNFQNTCCTPWDQPCSYVGGSMTLSIDPFTCAPPPEQTGAPWVCLNPKDTSTCTTPTTMEQPYNPNGPYKADITMTAHFGNQVEVSGVQKETGRHFRCTGKVSYDTDNATEWTCESCENGACKQCAAHQTYVCRL